ncbi:hypothetical protein Taro_024320 [Colocasia esculenta]|uniref:Uncharacterized protein n=1 Tax=Colocasia esculenta TaxID=4460 RepID=A0A843V6I3_COLES|nr:hypothetical protein [Colocasia esculenta]
MVLPCADDGGQGWAMRWCWQVDLVLSWRLGGVQRPSVLSYAGNPGAEGMTRCRGRRREPYIKTRGPLLRRRSEGLLWFDRAEHWREMLLEAARRVRGGGGWCLAVLCKGGHGGLELGAVCRDPDLLGRRAMAVRWQLAQVRWAGVRPARQAGHRVAHALRLGQDAGVVRWRAGVAVVGCGLVWLAGDGAVLCGVGQGAAKKSRRG